MFWSLPDNLDAGHLDVNSDDLSLIRRAVDVVSAVMTRVVTGPLRPIHADLHEMSSVFPNVIPPPAPLSGS